MLEYSGVKEMQRIRVWRSLVSRLNGVQEASSSNLDTRTKKAETLFTVSAFFFSNERFEHLNATRMSVAGEGLTEPLNYFSFSKHWQANAIAP